MLVRKHSRSILQYTCTEVIRKCWVGVMLRREMVWRQLVVDFAKRMEMAVMNTHFKKRECT